MISNQVKSSSMKTNAAFSNAISNLLAAIKNARQAGAALCKKIDQGIDALAQHPLLDKTELFFHNVVKNTRQWYAALQ